MNAPNAKPQQHPAPHAARVKLHESFFALFGGPIAWYLQLCTGYALASGPCFNGGDRLTAPRPGLEWTWGAMILTMASAVAIAFLAWLMSWRAYQRTQEERAGDAVHVMDVGSGRTRFLALWGVVLSIGFALATAITAVAFLTLGRCA